MGRSTAGHRTQDGPRHKTTQPKPKGCIGAMRLGISRISWDILVLYILANCPFLSATLDATGVNTGLGGPRGRGLVDNGV